MIQVSRAEVCVVACAELFRDAGEIMVSPMTTTASIGARLARLTFAPDILLTDAPRGEGYVPAGSVSLVVEIADSSLRWDLEDKRRLYALHDIPEYWVVNVAGWQLHRFWRARGGDYAGHDVVPLTGELRRATLAGLAIVGADIV